jgi:hypothetical protein
MILDMFSRYPITCFFLYIYNLLCAKSSRRIRIPQRSYHSSSLGPPPLDWSPPPFWIRATSAVTS